MWLKVFAQNSRTFLVRGFGQRFCSSTTTSEIGPVVVAQEQQVPRELPDTFLSQRKSLWEKYPIQGTSQPRQAWVEELSDTKQVPGPGQMIELHPDVWAVRPRLDIIQDNIDWQEKYQKVDYNFVKDRYELKLLGVKRPWPQKGMGRARHATHRSPLWIQGGKAHGPKGPTTRFFMLPYHLRVYGLIHTLSSKFAQDDVRIVENLEIPTDDPKFIEKMIDERNWGISALFVSTSDIFPRNITAATTEILHTNLMPVYGLNVTSMLKHKTLVLTVDAVNTLEEKLLFALRRNDIGQKVKKASTHGFTVC